MRGTPGSAYSTPGPARSGEDGVGPPADVEPERSPLRPSLDFEAAVIPCCPDPKYSELTLVLPACLRRVARWRTPPNWSRAEWTREVGAQARLAACVAKAEYDASRGVPLAAFLYQRVLTGVLTRYRQEWAFAVHCSHAVSSVDLVESPADSPRTPTADELVDCIRIILPRADRALLLAIFWQNRSEASISRNLGISQQAVSKRKRSLLRRLRRQLAWSARLGHNSRENISVARL